jgi:hypothetical protein
MPTPAHLTDQQMDAVLAAAHPLPPDRRSAFLEEVALALSRASVIGDGITHRIIMEAQRRFFDPPSFSSDSGSKWNGKAVPPRSLRLGAHQSQMRGRARSRRLLQDLPELAPGFVLFGCLPSRKSAGFPNALELTQDLGRVHLARDRDRRRR